MSWRAGILAYGLSAGICLAVPYAGYAQAKAAAQNASHEDAKWRGWGEIGGYLGGGNADRGEVAVFVPLRQNDESLLFTDLRGKLFEEQISEINAAVGYRRMLPSGWNLGFWAGADLRDSSEDNTFWAVSGGLEALSDPIDFRINGYWSLTDPKQSPGLAKAEITGNQVFITGGSEVPLSGVDGEVGTRLPLGWLGVDPLAYILRAYVGGFYFDADEALEEVTGPKARIEFRVDDFISAMPGSQLTLEGEWRSDDVRGGHVEGGVRFRVPFSVFSGDGKPTRPRSVQWRRMVDGLERDTDIVTVESEREAVEDALTGVDFDRVVDADATTGVTAPATAAGGNTLIVADGGAGTIIGPQVLEANQTLLGGSGTILVRGLRSGTTTTLTGPGSRPTFSNTAASAIFTAADRTHIAGANLSGNAAGSFLNDGVLLGSSQFVVLQDVDIADFSGAGIFADDGNTIQLIDVSVTNGVNGPVMDVNDFNTVTISDSRFSNTFLGILLDDDNAVTVDMTSLSDTGGDAFNMDNRNSVTISNATISNIGDDVVFGNDNNTITLTGTTVTTSTNDLFDFNDDNTLTVTDVTASGIGGVGFFLDDDNVVTVDNTVLSDVTFDVFNMDSRNTLTISNSTISDVGDDVVFGGFGNVITISDTTVTNSTNDLVDVLNANAVTLTNVTASGIGGKAVWVVDGNTVTVTGGSISTFEETIDAGDGNTIVLTDTTLSSTGGQEAIDVSDNNVLTISGVTASAFGNRVLEISNSNNVTVNLSTLGGTPTDTIGLDGTGNTLSGSGNVDESAPTGLFCDNAGVQTGSIGFTNATTCP